MSFIWKMCFAVMLALFVTGSVDSATMIKREIKTENQATTPKPPKICSPTLNCGWAVYEGFTRVIQYFMKNSCECPENQHCVRVDDDPDAGAFVYKCRPKRTTIPPPTTQE